MCSTTRREFLGSSAALIGAAIIARGAGGADEKPPKLPTVKWGKHEISRLLVGHNPQKGQSYTSGALDKEMKEWFKPETGHDVELLKRCQEVGINTCQMGAPPMEAAIRRFYAGGGRMQWIPTFYSKPGKGAADELKRILTMDPKPIGVQQWGQVSDDLFAAGKLDTVVENLKMFRDAGLLAGLGAHNPKVIEHAEEKGLDLDFYQCCFYHHKPSGAWPDEERRRMVGVIAKVSKPCIGFKVLGGNRHTKTPQDVYDALKFAFDSIKPTDVVLLGMWQKYKDQPGENRDSACRTLGAKA